jgi:L-seryl-tRNA(Ser) seleniumtransferase
MLLKVHQTNFRAMGFTSETRIAELAGLARTHDLPLVADVGSGLLEKTRGPSEPTLREALSDGADVVLAAVTSCSAGRKHRA